MFGPKLYLKSDQIGITLCPMKKEWAGLVSDMSSSVKVRMYTGGPYGETQEDQEEIYEGIRKNMKSVMWMIVPDGSETPVGYTAIHNISYDGSCSSEIMIFDQKWWNKGIASNSHKIRCWYASKHLNRNIIQASSSEKNVASTNALKSVGYFETGKKLRVFYRDGEYSDSICFAWLNPDRVDILYPNGLPNEYKDHVNKASEVINYVEKTVVLL